MKILVVEDDITVAKALGFLFASYNYAVDIAEDGDAGLQMADAYDYDLFLLDVILPKLDGISLCQQLRAKGCQSPILLLTGQGETKKKAIALNTGADDYVVKPFDPEELVARVQALLRRSSASGQSILSWGSLSVDPTSRKVAYGTDLVSLSPKAYAILELLLRKSQQPLNAHAILDHVWTSLESPGEDVVRSHIKELRHKFKAVGAPKDFIKTIYKVGYQLNPLYESLPLPKTAAQLTLPQVAELNAVNEELRKTLEQLRSTQAELQQKHQELEVAYRTIAKERQQLQAARDHLERRVAERTSELQAANVSLQQQQEQWQALFEYALDAIVIADDQGNYLDANAAACELFGVGKADLLRSNLARFAEPGLAIDSVWQAFCQTGKLSGEFRIYRPDGTIRETEFNAIANFVPGRHLSILHDISERKLQEIERQQTTLALRESERKLSTVINNLPGYVYRVANDLSYTPEFISEGVVHITGYQQADYLVYRTTSCGQEICSDDVVRVWDVIQQAVDSHQPYECEYRITTKEGIQKWVWARGQGVYSPTGELLYLEGFVTDITGRKQIEQALRDSQHWLQTILDHAPASIYLFDRQNRFLFANRICAELNDTTPATLVGQSIYAFYPTEVADRLAADNSRVFETGQRLQVEETLPDARGEQHTYLTVKFVLNDEGGTPSAICGISTDITERKHLENQSYHAQRLESLGILASGIAHDLNNILTPILAISKLLRLQQRNLEPQHQEMLQVIEDSAKRGASLIRQILTFTHETDEAASLIEIVPVIQTVIQTLQTTLPAGIQLETVIPDSASWLVAADANYLEEAFNKLCINAYEAMPDGGILTFSIQACGVDTTLAQAHLDVEAGDYVVITIADTGTGIPPAIRTRIFDPFFTTHTPGQGRGLGLSIVRGIVKSLGGFLQVNSAVGQGTQVQVYLPIAAGPVPNPEPTTLPQTGAGEGVLIVDDDLDVRTTNQTLLEHYHYRVWVASNGADAIALYTAHLADIQLVILDIMMPDMDGLALIQNLKDINPRVVMIAASGLPMNRSSALAAGAKVFLLKPYTLDQLLAAVQSLTRSNVG